MAINDVLAITPADSTNLEQPGNQSFYYHKDHQGSVRALTNDAGAVVNSYDYDSYGNIKSTSETVPQPFRYTGQQYDIGPQLYYYRNRTYDPRTGRFLQEDPLWFGGGDLNTYNYVLNNPVNMTDPMGLSAVGYGATRGIGGAAAAGATRIVKCLFSRIADEVAIGFAGGQIGVKSGKCKVLGIAIGAAIGHAGTQVAASSPPDSVGSNSKSATKGITATGTGNNCEYQYNDVDIPVCRAISRTRG